jgi:hypothetical protein
MIKKGILVMLIASIVTLGIFWVLLDHFSPAKSDTRPLPERTAIYMEGWYSQLDDAGKQRLGQYDIVITHPIQWPILSEMQRNGKPGQKLGVIWTWLDMTRFEDRGWPKNPTFIPLGYWSHWRSWYAGMYHPEWLTDQTYRQWGTRVGHLAPLDNFEYIRFLIESSDWFFRLWKAHGVDFIMLEWGWFSEYIAWLLGQQDPPNTLDPERLRLCMYQLHWGLTLKAKQYGFVIINQNLSRYGCPSDLHALAFDIKYENPDIFVTGGKWDDPYLRGPGWRLAVDPTPGLSFFETQRKGETDEEWIEKLAEHIEICNDNGLAIVWYERDRNYHKGFPELPEGY